MTAIRTGIVGVGNNAAAMVQGVFWYATQAGCLAARERREGIRFPTLCGYGIQDVVFSCAFDVDTRKIGVDLSEAIFAEPNRYPRAVPDLPSSDVIVHAAPVLDGIDAGLTQLVHVDHGSRGRDPQAALHHCARILRDSGTDVLINFLPSGSDQATAFFAEVATLGGAAYINCTPSPAVHEPRLVELFTAAGQPLLGDDLESQFGSSLIHRTLLTALQDRGLEILHSYQVNLGGNTDFKNLSHRPDAKRRSKHKAISTARHADRVDIVPSGGFVPGLGDQKVGYIVIEGRGWLDMPVTIDLKLKVQDSSNAAGVTIDLIRLAQGARDRGLAGYVHFPYYFKNPAGAKISTEQALREIERFNAGEPT